LKKIIGYHEDELKSDLTSLDNYISDMDFEIRMMEEQGLELRSNLDWKSSAKRLRIKLELIKRRLDAFGVVKIPFTDVTEYNYEKWQSEVKEKFEKEHNKQRFISNI